MRIKALIFGIALFSFSASCLAYINRKDAFECDGCTPSDLRGQAMDDGLGDHYFFDMTQQKLSHFQVTGTPNAEIVTKVPVTPNEQQAFNATQALYNVTGTLSLVGSVSVNAFPVTSARVLHTSAQYRFSLQPLASSTRSMNAFDLINTPANQTAAIDAATAGNTFGGFAINTQTAIAGFVNNNSIIMKFLVSPVTIVTQVTFTDGSTSLFSYDFNTKGFAYVPGSSKDAFGNPIPENALTASNGPNSTQRYVYPGTALGMQQGALQINNLNNLGISPDIQTITYGSSWAIACTNIGGYLPKCVAYPL